MQYILTVEQKCSLNSITDLKTALNQISDIIGGNCYFPRVVESSIL